MLDGRTDPAMALIFAQGEACDRSAADGTALRPLAGGAGIWAGLAALFAVFSPGGDARAAEPVPVAAGVAAGAASCPGGSQG